MLKRTVFIAAAITLATATGCNNTPMLAQTPAPNAPVEGMYSIRHSGFDNVYIRPGIRLADYKLVAIEPLELSDTHVVAPERPPGILIKEWALTPKRQQALRDIWASSSQRALPTVAATNADKTLRISAKLTRIAPSSNIEELEKSASRTSVYTEDSGDFSVEFRLVDANSAELLAVIEDKREAGIQLWQRTSSVQVRADTRHLFNRWSQQLAELIETPLP